MKISYISDLHLDFWIEWTPNQTKWEQRTREFIQKLIETDTGEREVFCLGGDYSHFNSQTLWMMSEFSKAYELVLYVEGNHDHYLVSKNQSNKYKGKYDHIRKSQASLARVYELEEEALKRFDNVIPLKEGRAWSRNGIKFGGDTMWYPVDTTEQQVFYDDISNDSRLIYGRNPQFDNHVSLSDYDAMVNNHKIDVMISHVPLIPIKSHADYRSTACYYTPVGFLPNYVIQGHSHERAIYEKADSKIFMNCLGYPTDNLGAPSISSFEIKETENI